MSTMSSEAFDQARLEQALERLPAIREATAALDEERLETLLSLIEDPDVRVVPIVGQELLHVPASSLPRPLPDSQGQPAPVPTLNHLLAQRLAADLRLPPGRVRADAGLDEVIAAHRPFASDRTLVHRKVGGLMAREEIKGLPIPGPLRQLATIRDFKLFVSTTWDDLLERALNAVWYGGVPGTRVLSFSPYADKYDIEPCDLDAPRTANEVTPPLIFRIFGTVSETESYAATEGDMVEFLHELQHEKRPEVLLAELRRSHLLILGTDFPNWLARFFLRLARAEKLWVNREKNEYFADSQLVRDPDLCSFIQHYSKNTQAFPKLTAAAFVERLWAEWLNRNPERALTGALPVPGGEPVIRANECVFVSYASEDREGASKIRGALAAMGWPVWFDRKDLESGADYEQKIERTIKAAQACVVVLSPHTATEGGKPRFFRKEWSWALTRKLDFKDVAWDFLHPVRLTPETPIPASFQGLNVMDAFDGTPTTGFLDELKRILRLVRVGKPAPGS